MTLLRDKTKHALTKLSRKDLRWLLEKANKEMAARKKDDQEFWENWASGMQGMANVMAGVTWALACRQSLRRSKEHAPDTGKRPASGEMWLPRELLTALRLDIKDRQWSPLGAENAAIALQNLRIERDRKPVPADDTFKAVAFRIPFARETAAVHIDLGASRYD